MKPSSARPAFVAVLLLLAHTAMSQISVGTKPIYPIEFKPGASTTKVEGTVSLPRTVGPDMTNEGSERYLLSARAGQYLTMEVSSKNHQALFTLVKPSPSEAKIEFVEKAGGVRRWSGRLKMSGDYLVIVFTRQQAGLSRFKLHVTLR